MRVQAVFCLVVVAALSAACTTRQPNQTNTTIADPDGTIDEATYRAVQGTVFDRLLAEARELASLDDEVLAERVIPETVTKEDLEARLEEALEHHRVSSEQMAYFALENPFVVEDVNEINTTRMQEIQQTLHQIVVRLRERGVDQQIASVIVREGPNR